MSPRTRSESPDSRYWNEPNLGLTDVGRQHYVPRFYLHQFANSAGLVSAINLETGLVFEGPSNSIGFQRNFNNVARLPSGEGVSVEAWLADLENLAAPILRDLALEPASLLRLTKVQERDLARYLVAQSFRVPDFRDMLLNAQQQIGQRARADLRHAAMLTLGMTSEEADAYLDSYSQSEEGWFIREPSDQSLSQTAASMLSEINGFANLLQAMPWRIGECPRLYTSDNPMSGWLPYGDPFGGAFAAQTYFFPVSTNVLLRMGPVPDPPADGGHISINGPRSCHAFSEWEASVARHVVSSRATKFLFGPGPYVDRDCAEKCLSRVQEARQEFAVQYLDKDLVPSWGRSFPPFRFKAEDAVPAFADLHQVLWDFENHRLPTTTLARWIPELGFMATHSASNARRIMLAIELILTLSDSSQPRIKLLQAASSLRRNIDQTRQARLCR